MKIQAAVVHEAGQPFQIEEVELSGPKAGELLVKIVASGVCHTDEVAQHQGIPVPLPAVLGHEGCGIVEEVGEGVKDFKKGDRVSFSFGFCGHCENCLSAHQHACENFNAINFGGVMADGTKRLSQNGVELSSFFGQSSFATYAVVHQDSTIKEEKKWLENTQTEAGRMKELLDNLLFLARSDAMQTPTEYAAFDLSNTLWSCILPFESLAFEQNVALEENIAQNISFLGDEGQIKQLIAILLDNACKYVKPKCTITVTLEKRQEKIWLEVKNTGDIIPREELDHLF